MRFTRHSKLERRFTWIAGGLAILGIGVLVERAVRARLARKRDRVYLDSEPLDWVDQSSMESFPASDSPAHHSIT